MKKQLLFLLTTIITINSYSQIIFEKGYFINNSDQKVDCLIKNIDWRKNPTEFEYKLSENSNENKASIKNIKEFGINNIFKYLRSKVKIDISSENLNQMSYNKNPILKEEELFLKVLIEGKSNLYVYNDGNLQRYLYNKENSTIEQLIFKHYKKSNVKIAKNNQFKQQLWNDLKCSSIIMNTVENLDYKKNSLINFFSQYNKCSNSDFINYEKKHKRGLFHLTLRPRLNNSSLSIQNSVLSDRDTDFGKKLGFGFGVEAEFILPFNKNKWAILIEPTYQSFKEESTRDKVDRLVGGKLISEVKYNSIEIPVGLRHYFFLTNNSKIFINTSFIFELGSKSSIKIKRADHSIVHSLDIRPQMNFAFGLGYKLNDKYSLEMRHQTSRNILAQYSSWNGDYKTVSVILGYSLF